MFLGKHLTRVKGLKAAFEWRFIIWIQAELIELFYYIDLTSNFKITALVAP